MVGRFVLTTQCGEKELKWISLLCAMMTRVLTIDIEYDGVMNDIQQ
jgi:hypothetical protein